jgi:hypothetical protein
MNENVILKDQQERIASVIRSMISNSRSDDDRMINPSVAQLEELRTSINLLFADNGTCLDLLYTINTDKPLFAINVSPVVNNTDVISILFSENRLKFSNYKLELDSKLFDLGLDAEEISSLIIYQISSIIDSYDTIDNLRAIIDRKLTTADDVINIRDSVNYSQLVIFAIKNTINKITSFIFKEDNNELTSNPYISELGLEDSIITARDKVISSLGGANDVMRMTRPVLLDWMLIMYKNMKTNSMIIIDTLKDARSFTASKLDIEEINKCLSAVDRIDSDITFTNESLDKFFDRKNISAVNEISIFKTLKKNGLRGIENELYEYNMRVKNCTDSDEATVIMRGINSRIGILDDYLANEELNDNDYKHWTQVANAYRDLRIALTKKKLQDKQYGLFFRYDKLDEE